MEITGPKTAIVVEIRVTGPLAWLWGPLVGRRHARALPAQTARILAAASALSSAPGVADTARA